MRDAERKRPQRSQNRTHCCSPERTLVVRSSAGVRGDRQIGMTNTEEGHQQGNRPGGDLIRRGRDGGVGDGVGGLLSCSEAGARFLLVYSLVLGGVRFRA
jgi:hypothetical protein